MNVDALIKKIALSKGYKEDVLDRGLVIHEKDDRKRRNRNDYEAHKRERVRKQKERDNSIVKCPLCLQSYKYSSLTKHKNNKNCKSLQAIIKEMTSKSKES